MINTESSQAFSADLHQRNPNHPDAASTIDCLFLAASSNTPLYASESQRRSTFCENGWFKASPTVEELVSSGFYFVGPNDRTQCFSCGVQLEQWEPTDNPMTEHRKNSPSCIFVSVRASEMGVEEYKRKFGEFMVKEVQSIKFAVARDDLQHNPKILVWLIARRYLCKNRSQYPNARELIKDSIQFRINAITRADHENPDFQISLSNVESFQLPVVPDVKHQLAQSASADQAPVKSKREENCLQCELKLPNMMYLPCGHVVMCDTCSAKIGPDICTVCFRQIESTIKVFVS